MKQTEKKKTDNNLPAAEVRYITIVFNNVTPFIPLMSNTGTTLMIQYFSFNVD
jgi:hypothetical protein